MTSEFDKNRRAFRQDVNLGRLQFAEMWKKMYNEFYDVSFEEQKMLLPIEHHYRESDYKLSPEFIHLWDNFEVGDEQPVKFDFSKIQKFTWAEWREYFEETVDMYKDRFE